MDVKPKEIYEGLNSIYRNLLPGIAILFPFFNLINEILISSSFGSSAQIICILSIYILASAISHMVWEMVGYLGVFFFENQSIREESKKGSKEISCCAYIFFIIFSSYFLYRHKLYAYYTTRTQSLQYDSGVMRAREKELAQKLGVNIDWINRLNSYLIAIDIYILGTVIVTLLLCTFPHLATTPINLSFSISRGLIDINGWYFLIPVIIFLISRFFAFVHVQNEIAYFERMLKIFRSSRGS